MAPAAAEVTTPVSKAGKFPSLQVARFDLKDPKVTTEILAEALLREGGIVVENYIDANFVKRLRREVGPWLDNDVGDTTGFFPKTTQRITGLIAKSPACVDLMVHKAAIDVANAIMTSEYTYRLGEELKTVHAKPILSCTAAFRINPGSPAQVLHRDDADYHAVANQLPVMMGAMVACTKVTHANGGTRIIPGSQNWTIDKIPRQADATTIELNPGDCVMFLGNVFHGGGENTTKDESREMVGMFYQRSFLRPAENQFLEVPLQKAAQFTPQVQRLLGYGLSKPGLGVYEFQDPMKVIFKVEDEENEVWGQ